jgi:hypothetical protein
MALRAQTVFWALMLIVSAFPASFAVDSWLVQRVMTQVQSDFPNGVSFDAAQQKARLYYPRSTSYSAADCEYWAHHGVPAYPARGGRCIFGIKKVPWHMWGDADVSFRLMFAANDTLAARFLDPIYTFL